MQDARIHRAQADLCLRLAGQIGDIWAAEVLRTTAAEHVSKAVELEAMPPKAQAAHVSGPRSGAWISAGRNSAAASGSPAGRSVKKTGRRPSGFS
jgi:hypothetical protein